MSDEITELRRIVAMQDKAYTDACIDKRALEVQVECIISKNTSLNNQVAALTDAAAKYRAHIDNLEFEVSRLRGVEKDDRTELESLLAAVERELTASVATVEKQRATIKWLEGHAEEHMQAQHENVRLRDVIVHQASLLAGCHD